MKVDWRREHKNGGLSYLVINGDYSRIAFSINEGGFPMNLHFSWSHEGEVMLYLYTAGVRVVRFPETGWQYERGK